MFLCNCRSTIFVCLPWTTKSCRGTTGTREEKWRRSHHWNGNVIILMKFSSLAALKVVILTTFGAASDENFIKMMTFSFQWLPWWLKGCCSGFHSDRSMHVIGQSNETQGGTREAEVSLRSSRLNGAAYNRTHFFYVATKVPSSIQSANRGNASFLPRLRNLSAANILGDVCATVIMVTSRGLMQGINMEKSSQGC